MIYKNEYGMYCFENDGFIDCDGITIDNLKGFGIDFSDDEIYLMDVNNNYGGKISQISSRKYCIFTEYGAEDNVLNFKDYTIIIDGKVNENICGCD